MLIPQTVIDEISSKLSLVDIVQGYLPLTRKGGRYWGLCPFHNEKTPSFTIYPDGTGFYCFGCQKGGSIFTFIQEIEHFSFPEAVEHLAEKAGVKIERAEYDAEYGKRKALTDLYSRVAGSFHYILMNKPEAGKARRYLEQRGIEKETWIKYKLGFSPSNRYSLHKFLTKQNYTKEFLGKSGLFSQKSPNSSFFSNRIMFPIDNARGDVIAFGGRAVNDEVPKYINSPETSLFSKSRNLYGLHLSLPDARKLRTFVISEGYIDILSLYQAGVRNCVAPLGTAFTDAQAGLIKRYADTCCLLFDGDEAGISAAIRAINICEDAGIACEVVPLPEGKDPAEVMEKEGAEALKNKLKYTINSFTYILEHAAKRSDIAKPEGKEEIVRYLLPYIDKVRSEVRKESYLDQTAQFLGVDTVAVQRDYVRLRQNGVRKAPEKKRNGIRFADMSPELFLMLAVSANRDTFPFVRNMLTIDDFADENARTIFIALEDCFRKNEEAFESFLQKIDDKELKQLLLEKSASDEFTTNGNKLISDSVLKIKEKSLIMRRDLLIKNMSTIERENDGSDRLRALVEDKMHIDAELEKIKESKE